MLLIGKDGMRIMLMDVHYKEESLGFKTADRYPFGHPSISTEVSIQSTNICLEHLIICIKDTFP